MAKVNNHAIAIDFVENSEYKNDLAYASCYDLFYLWQNGWYKKVENKQMEKIMWKFLTWKYHNINITSNFVQDIVRQLKWALPIEFNEDNNHYLAFKDRLLNLETFEPEEFSREKFVTFYVPFIYDEISTPTPNFNKFLSTSIVHNSDKTKSDKETVIFIQEMFGAFLISTMEAEVAFFLVGGGSNGKSTMLKVLRSIFSDEFRSAMSLQEMTSERFATVGLIGKKINISDDDESKYLQSSKFKAIVTGNEISAERKFGEKFSFIPTTKYVFSTQKIPTFDGVDYGIVRRVKIVPFYKRFVPAEKDHQLSKKLLEETAGILGWAIVGAKRLIDNNFVFTESKAITNALSEFESEMSSTIRFIRESYVIDPKGFTAGEELYAYYRAWCDNTGKKPSNKYSFLKDIKNNLTGVDRKRGRYKGDSVRGFTLISKEQYKEKTEGKYGEGAVEVEQEDDEQTKINF